MADADFCKDLIVERLARMGAAYVAKARRSVARYEDFVERHESLVEGGQAYPAQEGVITWFALRSGTRRD